MNDRELEGRLRVWYRSEVSGTDVAPLSLRRKVAAIPRTWTHRGRRFGRGRGMTLLAAAAAVLLVGGALAVGSGLLRRQPVPPVPTLGPLAVDSSDSGSPSASAVGSPSPGPSETPVASHPGVWIATGSMTTARYDNVAVRLADGRVLVAGGYGSDGSNLTSAELYDPATGTWTATGSMLQPGGSWAALLGDGRALVQDTFGDRSGAEVYDPATGTRTRTSSTADLAAGFPPIVLLDGRVLIGGGDQGPQLYDPASGTWTATPKMVTPRYNATATLLADGRVLVAGGDVPPDRPTPTAELYDPGSGSWTATANLPANVGAGTMTALLQDGSVLAARYRHAALYDPATGVWTATGDLARSDAAYNTITRLLDGRVLVANGRQQDANGLAEVYDPSTRSWTTTGSMSADFWGSVPSGRATLLLDGTVLMAGSPTCSVTDTQCPSGASGTAELFVPSDVNPPALGPFPSPTPTPTPTPMPSPFPPTAGPVPQGARSFQVTVVNKSSKPIPLFLALEPLTDMSQLCGSATPDVVPAGVTLKVTFLLPPKSVGGCWLMVRPRPGASGAFGPTSDWPIPGRLVIQDGGDNTNGDDVSTGWVGP